MSGEGPVLWERIHTHVLMNELRKARKASEAKVVQRGRIMFAVGLLTGLVIGWLM